MASRQPRGGRRYGCHEAFWPTEATACATRITHTRIHAARRDLPSWAVEERALRRAVAGGPPLVRTHEVTMNLTMMLLLHAYPDDVARAGAPLVRTSGGGGPGVPRPQDPGPEGGEGESVGDGDDEEPGESGGTPKPEREAPSPDAPPAAPDANPIDPRIFGSIH